MSHPDFLEGALPVAPSAIRFDSEIHTPGGKKKIPVPRALEQEEILEIVEKFRLGARNAKKAGFDGVEIHGANGYLLDQFLRDGSNTRTDQYGGSVENRARFPLEVARAVTSEWEPGRVGYRISPHFLLNGMSDSNPKETFSYLTRELDRMGIGYMHLIEPVGGRMGVTPPGAHLSQVIRSLFPRTIILNGGFDDKTGNAAIEDGKADLISYGISFLSNPDLPERFKRVAPLNKEDIATFYAGEEKGYTDYPTLEI
jgi:N-ethylmaleimide reductase